MARRALFVKSFHLPKFFQEEILARMVFYLMYIVTLGIPIPREGQNLVCSRRPFGTAMIQLLKM